MLLQDIIEAISTFFEEDLQILSQHQIYDVQKEQEIRSLDPKLYFKWGDKESKD